MPGKWQKARQLSLPEWRLLAQALPMFPLTGAALRVVGFNRWQSALLRLSPVDKKIPQEQNEKLIEKARMVARIVRIASRWGPYRANCLQESLILWWLLRRRRIESRLRFGARKEAGRMEAHAWVEFMDLALNDSQDVEMRFSPFDRDIASAEARDK